MTRKVGLKTIQRKNYSRAKAGLSVMLEQAEKQSKVDTLSRQLAASPENMTIQSQASYLGQPQIQGRQRQIIARQLGHVGGNLHLQRVINRLKQDDLGRDSAGLAEMPESRSSQSRSPVVQRGGETTTAKRGGGNYEVVAGDTLWGIAKATYGQGNYWREIYKVNPDKVKNNGDLIFVGTILALPVLDITVADTAEPSTPTGPEADVPALYPKGVCTDFGNFDIYPDDFIGPLPQSVRSATSWPIQQADYDQLITRMTQVQKGSSNFKVNGTDSFKTTVFLDLGWLMTSDVGQLLVKELQDGKHTVTIQESAGGNGENAASFNDGLETTDTPPKPGPGSDVTVDFNPNKLFIKDGSLDWHNRPPAIGLAHELVHAWADVYGMTPRGETGGVKRYELQAVGLGDFAKKRISENKFRAAFGLPLRPEY